MSAPRKQQPPPYNGHSESPSIDDSCLVEVVDSCLDAIILMSASGVVQRWNPGAEAMFGVPGEEAVGASTLGTIPPERQAELDHMLSEVRAGRTVPAYDTIRTRASGEAFPASVMAFPILGDDDKLLGCATIQRDISERVRAADELRRALSEAQQANLAKANFLANMSHELLTPMNAILGMTQLALEESLPQQVTEYLETTRESARAMLRLIDDVLDMSRMSSGGIEFEEEDFSLRDTIDQSLRPLGVEASSKGLDFEINVDRNVPDGLWGDPLRLRQVLTNIVGNAVKFTERGRVHVGVESLLTTDSGCKLRFTVEDSGIGMSQQDQQRVTAPFVQADASSTRPYSGSGLGLAITKRLIHAFGGRIEIESQLGRGSRVEFTLPLSLSPAPAEHAKKNGSPPAPNQRPSHRPLLILVVEDTPANQKVVKSVLSKRGHRVRCAANGREAVAMASQTAFDLIVMDIQMPIMDGLEATAEIRSRERESRPQRHTPIIAMTAHTTRGVRQKCIETGMDAYVPKPVDIWKMVETIESLAAPAPQQQSFPQEYAPLNVNLDKSLARLGGDRQLLRDLIGFFLEDSPELLQNASDAAAAGEWDQLRRAAHSLKGLAASFDADEVQDAADELEMAAKNHDTDACPLLTRALKEKADSLAHKLREHLSESR